MKVEKAFTIDGVVVTESFQNGDITIYQSEIDCSQVVCYFVDNKTGEVLFKQTVEADMGQGTGYVSNVNFVGVK